MTFPDVVVVAGGVAQAGQLLLEPARRELVRVGARHVVERLALMPATLGADAAVIGAALSGSDVAY